MFWTHIRNHPFVHILGICVLLVTSVAYAEPNNEELLVKALREALKSEKDPIGRIFIAKALIRVAAEEKAAADELVKALTMEGDLIPIEGYKAISEAMPASPPALIVAVTPLLKHPNKDYRRQAAELLSKVNPKELGGLQYYSLRYNDVRQKSAHNAYERSKLNNVYEDIFDLIAYWHVRSLELDIHEGKGDILQDDWRIYHSATFDGTSVDRLSVALDLLAGLQRALPSHDVITVFIDLKDPFRPHHTPELLDRVIRDKLGQDAVFTPKELLDGAANLQAAVTGTRDWPRLAELRGKFVFVLTGETDWLDEYVERGAKAGDRVAFIAPEISDPKEIGVKNYAVFFNMTADKMAALGPSVLAQGFVSRAYKPTLTTGGFNSAEDWKLAVDAKVHHIATDKHNSKKDPWARTHNDFGWPFEELAPSTKPQFSERGSFHTLTVKSGDFSGKQDSGFFVYSPCPSADQVTFVIGLAVPSSHSEDNAKALVMARSSLEADAPYFAVLKPADNGGPRIQFREVRGGDTTIKPVELIDPDLLHPETPGLVKLQISNNHQTVTAWAAIRGDTDWKLIRSHTFSGTRMKYCGVAASSLDKNRTVRAFFSIVQGSPNFSHQAVIGEDVSYHNWERGKRP